MISEREPKQPIRVAHLVPGDDRWVLRFDSDQSPVATFQDLGAALDAAVAGPEQVRVVVHERGAA
jgi:hypothetical protein